MHRDFYAQECGFSASTRFRIYGSICDGRLICACGTSDRATARQLARPEFRGQPASMILTRVQSTRPTAPGVKITLGPRNSLVRLSARPRGRSGWRAQIARPASRRLPSALRRGKASPQRGNEEKRAAAAGEAASRVRRPAEARSRPTVRRLGCGTPARRGGGESTFAGLQRCASRSRCTEGHQDPRTPGRLQKAFGRLSTDSHGENSLRQPSATIA